MLAFNETVRLGAIVVGAVLEQEGENGEMHPIAFFSNRLPPFKQVRSTFYKELRGVYLSLKHFQSRILGRSLIIRTDSKSVERAITNEVANRSPAEQRWICFFIWIFFFVT